MVVFAVLVLPTLLIGIRAEADELRSFACPLGSAAMSWRASPGKASLEPLILDNPFVRKEALSRLESLLHTSLTKEFKEEAPRIAEIRLEFLPGVATDRSGRPRDIVKIQETVLLDTSDIARVLNDQANRMADHAKTCVKEIVVQKTSVAMTSQGGAAVKTDLQAKFYKCTKITELGINSRDLFATKEVDLNYSLLPEVDKECKDVWIKPENARLTNTEFNDVGNLILNVVGIATANIGSKLMLDNYRGALASAEAQIAAAMIARKVFTRLPLGSTSESLVGQVDFTPQAAGFQKAVKGPMFVVVSADFEQPSTAREYRVVMDCLFRLVRSLSSDEQRAVELKPGETLWAVAKREYCSGTFAPELQAANPTLTAPSKIAPGTAITIPAFFKIVTSKGQ